VLVEHECVRPARPSLEEIRLYLRGAPFANWADRARSFAAADTLSPKDQKSICGRSSIPVAFTTVG
jgi:hypothetical protein